MTRVDLSQNNSNRKASVVCPIPRRIGLWNCDVLRPSEFPYPSHEAAVVDSKAGPELFDLILGKESSGAEKSASHISSSPPFFPGSPPRRAVNPLIQDTYFGELSSFSALPNVLASGKSSPSSSARKGMCARGKSGQKPATVRVEGFDCLSMDGQSSRITAVA